MANKLIKYLPFVVFAIIFIFMLRLNNLTPLWADDYCRLSNSTSLFQIISTSIDRYFTWNGRFFIHLINYTVFGNYPASIIYFNFINSTFFCLLIYLIFYIVFNRKPEGYRDTIFIILIFSLLFVSTQGIGEVALWKTGSIGYLWGVVFELIALIPFLKFVSGNIPSKTTKGKNLLYFTTCLIGPFFIENLSLPLTVTMIIIYLKIHLENDSNWKWLLLPTFLHSIGTLFLFGSRGNFIRATLFENPMVLNDRIVSNIAMIQTQSSFGWIFLFFWFAGLTNKLFFEKFRKPFFWYIISLATGVLLTFSVLPTEQLFNYRRAFPFEIFVIIAIVYIASLMPKIKIFELTLTTFLLILLAGHTSSAIKNAEYIKSQIIQRSILIDQQKQSGKKLIVVPEISFLNTVWHQKEIILKYKYKSDIGNDPNDWTNTCYAKGLGLEQIITSTK